MAEEEMPRVRFFREAEIVSTLKHPQLVPALSSNLEAIMPKCLEKRPDGRFINARLLQKALLMHGLVDSLTRGDSSAAAKSGE